MSCQPDGLCRIGLYLDTSLAKQVGHAAAAAKVRDLSGKISVSIPIPATLLNNDKSADRLYSVVHIHDGKAVCEQKTGREITLYDR